MKVLAIPRDRSPYQGLLHSALAARGVTTRYAGELTPSHTLNLLLLPLELVIARMRGYTVLHIHWVFGFLAFGAGRLPGARLAAGVCFRLMLALAGMLGMRIVWTAHNVLPHERVFRDDAAARRRLVAASHLVIAHDPSALEAIEQLGARPRRSVVIPPGPLQAGERVQGPPAGGHPRRLLFFGRVEDYKGVPDLLRALARAPGDVHVTVAGECRSPALRAEIEELAANVPGDRVDLRLERIPEDEVAALFVPAAAVVLPFRRVTTSSSALLALANGRPVVVPDLPAFREIPDAAKVTYDDGETGLAGALDEIARMDAGELRARGEAAREFESRRSWPVAAERTHTAISAERASAKRGVHAPPAGARSGTEALRRLAGRGSVYTLGLGLQMSVAFLVLPLVTRMLEPSAYGRIALALVVVSIVSVLSSAGLPEAAGRFFFEGEPGPAAAHRLVVATIAIAAVVGVAGELLGPLWAPILGLEYGALLRLALVDGVAVAAMLAGLAILRAGDRVWSYVGVIALASVGAQALAAILTATRDSPTAYMTGLTVGTALAALVAVMLAGSSRYGIPGRAEVRRGLAFGLPLVAHGLALFLLGAGDRVAIVSVLGLDDAGRYQVAYVLGSIGVALVVALNQAWLPLLLGADEEHRREIVEVTSRAVHRGAAVVAGLLALAAPLALALAAPPSYEPADLVPIGAIVAFSILPYATTSAFFHLVFLSGTTRVMAVAAPLAAAVNLGLNFLLLPVIGLLGSAVATVLAYGLLAAIAYTAARRRGPVGRLPLDALRCWAVAAPFVAAGALLPGGVAGSMGRALAAGALVGLAAYWLREAPRPWPWLRARLRRGERVAWTAR